MSISIWFNTFCNNIRLSDVAVNNISYRYKRITRQLNVEFWNTDSQIANSFYVGSYGRGTDIHVSDIDVIFVLPPTMFTQYDNYIYNGQSSLLQTVKGKIEQTYPSSLKADGQVIGINFSDGIRFELVPAFLNNGNCYIYPDSNAGGSWKTTNPKPEIAAIAQKNNEWNKNLKRLCRMARAWKDYCGVPLGGLLIDTLAYNFLSGWEYRDKSYAFYDWMSRDFFKFMSEQNNSQTYWISPGGRQYVWRSGNFEYKAKQAYKLSLEAIENEEKYPYTAKTQWRQIYGTKFPS